MSYQFRSAISRPESKPKTCADCGGWPADHLDDDVRRCGACHQARQTENGRP